MIEVDTIFSIKRSYALLAIYKDILNDLGLNDAKPMKDYIIRNFHWEENEKDFLKNFIEKSLESAVNPKKSGRFSKYYEKEKNFMKKDIKSLEGKVIIISDCIGIDNNGVKRGIDPYSNSFTFSNNLTKLTDFNKDFLEKIVITYMHPVMFNQILIKRNEKIYVTDLSEKDKLNSLEAFKKLTDSAMYVKEADFNSRIGIANYDLQMFDKEELKKSIESGQKIWRKNNVKSGEKYKDKLIKENIKIKFNKAIMAIRWSYYFKRLHNNIIKTLDNYELRGLPLMMNNTSVSNKILNKANKLNEDKFKIPYNFIGGKKGIHAGKRKRKGIHENSAFGRFAGLLESICPEKTKINIEFPKIKSRRLETVQDEKYGWARIEEDYRNSSPTMRDMIDSKIKTEEGKEKLKIVNNYTESKGVGYSRIETHLYNLMNYKGSIYSGRRNWCKHNAWWPKEIKGKSIVFPKSVENLFNGKIKFFKDQDEERNIKSDFRGSEFSMSADCPIQKLISRLIRGKAYDIIDNIINKNENEKQGKKFNKLYNKILKEPKVAIRGTFLHELILNPYDDLVHYQTLDKIDGISSVPSDHYCETEFVTEYRGVKVSFHPDTFFLLEHEKNNKYDIVVLDVKTNRITPYPRISYLMQTGFYAKVIAETMKADVENIYVATIHNAFDSDFDGGLGKSDFKTQNFRQQEISPITKFEKNDPFLKYINLKFAETIEEKNNLLFKGENYFLDRKEDYSNQRKCSHCYFENKIICDYIRDQNIDIKDIETI